MIYTVNYDTLNDYWSINFPKNLDRPQIFSTKQPGLDCKVCSKVFTTKIERNQLKQAEV